MGIFNNFISFIIIIFFLRAPRSLSERFPRVRRANRVYYFLLRREIIILQYTRIYVLYYIAARENRDFDSNKTLRHCGTSAYMRWKFCHLRIFRIRGRHTARVASRNNVRNYILYTVVWIYIISSVEIQSCRKNIFPKIVYHRVKY